MFTGWLRGCARALGSHVDAADREVREGTSRVLVQVVIERERQALLLHLAA